MKMTRRLSAYVLHSLPPISPPRHAHTHTYTSSFALVFWLCVYVEKVFAVLTLRHSNNNNKTVRRTWKIVFDLNFVVGFFRVFLAVHIKDLSKQTLTKHLFNVFKYVERTQSKIDSSSCCCLLLLLPDFIKRKTEWERERDERGWQCVHKYFICLAVV